MPVSQPFQPHRQLIKSMVPWTLMRKFHGLAHRARAFDQLAVKRFEVNILSSLSSCRTGFGGEAASLSLAIAQGARDRPRVVRPRLAAVFGASEEGCTTTVALRFTQVTTHAARVPYEYTPRPGPVAACGRWSSTTPASSRAPMTTLAAGTTLGAVPASWSSRVVCKYAYPRSGSWHVSPCTRVGELRTC